MATPVLIPLSEYLNTTYDPDCDYIDGEVIERNVGEKQHGLLQGLLFSIFLNTLDDWQLLPVTEQRVTGPDAKRHVQTRGRLRRSGCGEYLDSRSRPA